MRFANSLATLRVLRHVGAALALVSAVGLAFAQPSVTKVIVPFAPGASNDLIGRMMAEAAAKKTGRNWIVENKPGAGSMLGAEFVAKAAPDGGNLLLCATANMGILPAIAKTVRYAPDKDFNFLVRIASSPFALAVNSQLPVNNFAEFVRLAKAKPNSIRVGSAGVGALDYMGASLMQSQLGIDLNIIPYKGMAPALNDLRAGHVDAAIVSPGTIRPMTLDGKIKVLAVFDTQRSEVMPNVPSAAELGHPQLLVLNWWGICGQSKMPAAVAGSLRQAMLDALADPAFLKSLKEKGFDPAVIAGDEFAKFVAADMTNWKEVARKANISLDE
jgi:tripartite-type tricarboxylate transporter receptor subunit TctC